jgi:hypothetical protein
MFYNGECECGTRRKSIQNAVSLLNSRFMETPVQRVHWSVRLHKDARTVCTAS